MILWVRCLASFALLLGLVVAGMAGAEAALADTPAPSDTPTVAATDDPTASPTAPLPSDSPSATPTVTQTVTVAPSPASTDGATVQLAGSQFGPLLWSVLAGFAILLLFVGVSTAKVLFGR